MTGLKQRNQSNSYILKGMETLPGRQLLILCLPQNMVHLWVPKTLTWCAQKIRLKWSGTSFFFLDSLKFKNEVHMWTLMTLTWFQTKLAGFLFTSAKFKMWHTCKHLNILYLIWTEAQTRQSSVLFVLLFTSKSKCGAHVNHLAQTNPCKLFP